MVSVFEVRSSGVLITTTHDLIHFGGVKTAVLRAKYIFKNNSRKCKRNCTRRCTILYSASVFGIGSSHDCKKIRNYQTVLFFAAPWCALVLIDLELPGDDGLIHSNSDSVCWKRELVHGWPITQYPAVKAWNKLGFVHNTSSPDSDADLEYNWKTCRKRKKYNVWSLIKFF